MRKFLLGAALPIFLATPLSAQTAPRVATDDLMRHIEVLAADDFEGRKPGTAGETRTLDYVATQMRQAGLTPGAASGSWYQPVELLERKAVGQRAIWTRNGQPIRFNQGDLVAIGSEPVKTVEKAPVWFAGRGLADEIEGADLRGAIVLILNEAPSGTPSYADRVKAVAQAGAAAVIGILGENTAFKGYSDSLVRGQTRLAGDSIAPIQGAMPYASGERLIEEGGGDFEAVAKGPASAPFKAVRLSLEASLDVSTAVRRYPSYNILGRLPGSGGTGETVLYLAHWDHTGICAPEAEDKICNGAVDNASGIAVLLETAKHLASGPRPRRDLLFLATTAEEMGLLGASAFAADPPVPLKSIVAAVNIDTIAITGAGEPVAIIGRGRTGIDPLVEAAARELGRKVDTDSEADMLIERQDGWMLTRAGVPTIMAQGAISDMAKLGAFLSGPYHKPSDQVDAPIVLEGAAEDTDLLIALGRKLADPALYKPPAR